METLHSLNFGIFALSALVLAGIFSSLAAKRFGAPMLLVFLLVGMFAGTDGPGGIEFEDYALTYVVGSLALAVILFDGGLRTRLSVFREALAPALALASIGVVLTATLTGLAAYFLVEEFSLLEALLLGAIVASTDAAAVFFLLKSGGLQLQSRVGSVLEVESSTNDPIAVFLTLALTQLALVAEGGSGLDLVGTLLSQAVLGALAGLAGGIGAGMILNRTEMPGGLHPLFVVAAAILIFSATAAIGGSGFLAVYLAGLVLANRPVRAFPSILGFHNAATWLAQIAMFLVLGLLVTPTTLMAYALPGFVVALALMFLTRPIAVFACLAPFGFSRNEKLFVSWVGLRGAVSIFLAAIPTLAGVPHAAAYFNIAFFVVLVSLVLQGWTITSAARGLGVALRRAEPSIARVELDIPGQLEHEMVGYPVRAESLVLQLKRLPAWFRLLFVVRESRIHSPEEAGGLAPGDYAYLLVAPMRVRRLDRLFSGASEPLRMRTPTPGEFILHGDAPAASLVALYGLEVGEDEARGTLGELIERRLVHAPRLGDAVALGPVSLIVRKLDERHVVRAGLRFDVAEEEEELATGTAGRLRLALRRARRDMRRRFASLAED